MTQKFLRDDGQFTALAVTGSSGTGPITLLTNTTTAVVALNNTANYFDGPTVAQGTAGTWFVSGNVTCVDTVAAQFTAKLWDGTNLISAGQCTSAANGFIAPIALSGIITSPAGNLRISVKDVTSTNGTMLSSAASVSQTNLSSITAMRIG